MPARRPRRWSGMVWFQIVEAKDARDHVGGARDEQADQRQPQGIGHAEEHDAPGSPGAGGERDGQAVTVDASGPARCQRHRHRTSRERGVEQPEHGRAAIAPIGEEGVERDREGRRTWH